MPAASARSWLVACCLLLLSGSGCAGINRLQYSPLAGLEHGILYHPSKFPEGNWRPAGLKFEDASFSAEDGTKLHGWYIPHGKPRGVALLAHGNAGNITDCADTLRILHDRHQLTVLAFDYRGYGRSDGEPTEAGLYEDARAARAWLARRAGIQEADVILLGYSLGGGVMIDLAAKDGARGLVLTSTFTSLGDVGKLHVPVLHHLMYQEFDSLSKISRYHGPMLYSHGDSDELIPLEQGEKLFAAANEPKRFVVNRGGHHNSPQSTEYRKAFDEFLNSLPPVKPR